MRIGSVPEMTGAPEVSVVMSVYNGATALRDSVRSVLAQDGVELEFVIIDDGSTDGSRTALEELAAADPRIRLLRQENQGLTRALVRGCAVARGEFIARQDCGDLSLPGRLRAELDVIRATPQAALVSCGARFKGPRGEPLYEVSLAPPDQTDSLLTLELPRLRGPAHHGSTMFRRELYERVGGYREQFYFAQDLDLWTRLVERGRHIAIPSVLYEASFSLGSITSLQRRRQIESAKRILECARRRRRGSSESGVLAAASAIRPSGAARGSAERADALYFVGTCLRTRRDPRAVDYFREALRADPLHLRSAVRLLLG
jgi:glycosyltransferase involved in cell wall biosynthesis